MDDAFKINVRVTKLTMRNIFENKSVRANEISWRAEKNVEQMMRGIF